MGKNKQLIGIAYLRRCLGITTEEFGELIGTSRHPVTKWENGAQKISKKKLELISEIFEIEKELLTADIKENYIAQSTISEKVKFYQYKQSKVIISEIEQRCNLVGRLEAENYILRKERDMYKSRLERIKKILKGDYSDEQD